MYKNVRRHPPGMPRQLSRQGLAIKMVCQPA
jgi:hypothetical protein